MSSPALTDQLVGDGPPGAAMSEEAGGSGQAGGSGGAAGAGAAWAAAEPQRLTYLAKLEGMLQKHSDASNDNARRMKRLAEKTKQLKREAEARAARREAAAQEEEEDEEEQRQADEHLALFNEMRQRMAPVDLEECVESVPVLEALPPRVEEAAADLDASYLEAITAAAEQLGLGADMGLEGEAVQQEMFRSGLRSGFVCAQALQRGAAGRPLVEALLSTLSRSPDPENAGSAFVTLMALMGDSGPSAGPADAEAQAPADVAAAVMLLDPHCGLPATLAAAAAAGCGGAGQPPRSCRLDCVPTAEQLLAALKDNGYCPGGVPASGGAAAGGRGGLQPAQQQQQQASEGADAVMQEAGGQQQQQAPGGEAQVASAGPPPLVRLQAVKLILHTAAAVCRYCKKHPEAAAGALSREGVSDLLLAALRLQLDPCATQLQEELDAVTIELLGALDEADWERKLPQLAERAAEVGSTPRLRFRLLRKLPAHHPRGWALQQSLGCLQLKRLLPAGMQASGAGSGSRRGGGAPDPAAFISAQPWFKDPKKLVERATSGDQPVPRGGYAMTDVELLLKVCHVLLWPHMLRMLAGEPSCLTQPFLTSWAAFLQGVVKHIKSAQADDRNVKYTASILHSEYMAAAEGCPLGEEDAMELL